MSNNEFNRDIIIIIVLVAAIVILFGFFSGFGWMGYYGMMNGGMWFFGWIFMVLLIIALVLFIMWLIKQLQNGGKRHG